jgi:hypothetical protein
MTGRHDLTLLASVAVTACASASQTAGATSCGLKSEDSVFVSRGPVYRACELGEARVLHANNPNFADAALRALATWRYRPALLHGVMAVPAGTTPRPPDRTPKC